MPRGTPRLRTAEGKKNQIGNRVKARREILKLTQDNLSGRIADITEGVRVPDLHEVYRIEAGRRTVTTLELMVLAEVLQCDPCLLIKDNSSN
jgi:transcriptional regulator with XRE-family HTH domain